MAWHDLTSLRMWCLTLTLQLPISLAKVLEWKQHWKILLSQHSQQWSSVSKWQPCFSFFDRSYGSFCQLHLWWNHCDKCWIVNWVYMNWLINWSSNTCTCNLQFLIIWFGSSTLNATVKPQVHWTQRMELLLLNATSSRSSELLSTTTATSASVGSHNALLRSENPHIADEIVECSGLPITLAGNVQSRSPHPEN